MRKSSAPIACSLFLGLPPMTSTEPSPVAAAETLLPMHVGGQFVYIAVRDLDAPLVGGQEREIAGRRATLDEALAGVKAFAQQTIDELHHLDATKVAVEFGCEFVVESGSVFAVIGKASAMSAMKVSLEWSKPIP